jgi:hypothetical protein
MRFFFMHRVWMEFLQLRARLKRESLARIHSIPRYIQRISARSAQAIHRFVHRKAGYLHANTG